MEAPAPIDVPLQLSANHFHAAPEPSFPPTTESVVGDPGHTATGLAATLAGAIEKESTLTITIAQPVILQVPSART